MKLNKIEKLKLELKPCDYYSKLDTLNHNGLTEADRFYLKNFGIYNTKLSPETFMLRLRIPAGRIEISKLKMVLSLAKKHDARIILTSRAQMELHGLSFCSVLEIHKNLEKNGITSWQTLTDNFRNIVTDPLDGVEQSCRFEVYPIILKMQEIFLKNPEFVGMIPRKFNTAISANSKNITSFFGNDCYFALAQKDGVTGFNLYLGGKNLEIAKSADIFVKKDEVLPLFEAIVKAYKKYGLRENRTKARLYHLLQLIGIEEFKERIGEFYKKEFIKAGTLLSEKYKENEDWFVLNNGSFAYRFKSRYGEIDIETFEKIVQFAEQNECEVRIGTDQNLYIIGLGERYFPLESLSQNENILACAGSRYCIFSLFDTKKEADRLILDDINRLGIKIGYSGCLKGCARHILSDIGFVGIRTNLFGKVERGVRLYLGGLYTKAEAAARMIYWAVPLRKLNSVLSVILDEFENSGFLDFEEFSKNILNSYSSEFLAFWFLARLYTDKKVYLKSNEKNLLLNFKEFDFYTLIEEDFYEAIKYLEKSLYIESNL
ncbi:nitrite/sulfite reductase [Nitrosophilus alvini]|uniref:nitrite/sulfite reductase n=1 Tax=Nitrosophilus alvini TaxID=2714855 RepID=UPI00190B31B8|nr:nitrite/sulfite reductase [Nitrosophilus alvini]